MMNKLRKALMVCLLMVASTCMVMAQQPNANTKNRGDKRANMEQLAQKQAERISQTLAFDDKTSKKFIETFCNCRKEMAAIRMERHHGKKSSEMTDAEIEKSIKVKFQQGRKLLDIREKYYAAYSKFLTQRQIQRVYELERQDMKHFAKRGQQRGKQGPNGQRPRMRNANNNPE